MAPFGRRHSVPLFLFADQGILNHEEHKGHKGIGKAWGLPAILVKYLIDSVISVYSVVNDPLFV